jgi:hypothetical protein
MDYQKELNYHLDVMKNLVNQMATQCKEGFKLEMLMNSIENNVSVIMAIADDNQKINFDTSASLKPYPKQILQLREESGYFDTDSVFVNPIPTGPMGKPHSALWTSSYLLDTNPQEEVAKEHRLEPITEWEDFAKEEMLEQYNGNLYEVMPIDDAVILEIDSEEMNIVERDGSIIVPFIELMKDTLLFVEIENFVRLDFNYLHNKYKVDIVHVCHDAVHINLATFGQYVWKYRSLLYSTTANWDVECSFWLNPKAIKEVKYIGKA